MAHTPGTWTLVGNDICSPGSGAIVMWAFARSECGREGDDYYSCRPPSPTVTVRWRSPEDLALALAAPDLLAALQMFIAAEDDWNERDGSFDDPLTDAYEAAKMAIAKAEAPS